MDHDHLSSERVFCCVVLRRRVYVTSSAKWLKRECNGENVGEIMNHSLLHARMLVTFKLYLLHAFRNIRALSCRVSWQCRLAQERHTVCCRYSFFPDEAEILLSPNARFIVANEATLEVHAAAAACRRRRCCCCLPPPPPPLLLLLLLAASI